MCLCSIWFIIIKIFRILKIVRHCQHPLLGGGVWCDILAVKVRTTTHQMARLGQSFLRYQPVCLWYQYTRHTRMFCPDCAGAHHSLRFCCSTHTVLATKYRNNCSFRSRPWFGICINAKTKRGFISNLDELLAFKWHSMTNKSWLTEHTDTDTHTLYIHTQQATNLETNTHNRKTFKEGSKWVQKKAEQVWITLWPTVWTDGNWRPSRCE